MIQDGEDVVVLAAGEPDFDTPGMVKEAAIKSIRDGFTKYTPASGMKSLKEAILQKLKKDNGLDYKMDEIVVSNGAKHSIYIISTWITSRSLPGKKVLCCWPNAPRTEDIKSLSW